MENNKLKKAVRVFGTCMLGAMLTFPTVAFASSAQTPTSTEAIADTTKEDTDLDQTELEQEDNENDSNEPEEKDSAKEAEENAALAAQATITEEDAITIVKKENSLSVDATVTAKGLESENGTVVYELTYLDNAGTEMEVKVDANSAIIYTEADDNAEYEE